MFETKERPAFDLQMFAEGADGAADTGTADASLPATGDATAPGEPGDLQHVDGEGTQETFDDIIKGRYKVEYQQKVQEAIAKRFKNQQDLQGRLDALNPMLQLIAERYGVQNAPDGKLDYDAIMKAVSDDNSMYEEEAFKRGMAVEDYKHMRQMETENAHLKAQAEARQREQETRSEFDQIIAQTESLKQVYPDFDLNAEMANPEFGRLLATLQRSGFPTALRTAYEVVHKDQILESGMRYAVQHTQEQTVKAIQSGSQRIRENGAGAGSPAQGQGIDPSRLSRKQIEDIKRRAAAGERITF